MGVGWCGSRLLSIKFWLLVIGRCVRACLVLTHRLGICAYMNGEKGEININPTNIFSRVKSSDYLIPLAALFQIQ